eukprot:5520442-Pleurochrysis_carterae.AAC.3
MLACVRACLCACACARYMIVRACVRTCVRACAPSRLLPLSGDDCAAGASAARYDDEDDER